MSAFNARKNVLERLREREKKRDWSELDKSSPSAPNTTRQWSAESYKVNNFIPLRKTPSPRHLPRLEACLASADSNYYQDLNHHQYQTAMPLLSHTKQKSEFERNGFLYYQPRDPGQRAKEVRNDCKAAQRKHLDCNKPLYPLLPSDSSHPKMGLYPHFPAMHPVPVIQVQYPGYAPWFMPGVIDGPLTAQDGYYARHTARPARPVKNLSKSKAAVILQKYTRGWLVRKSPRFAFWHYMCNKKQARQYIESLIDSYLMEEIIPDILIGVLSHKSFLSVKDPRYKATELVCFKIIHQDLTDFINETAIGIFYSFVNSHHSKTDPLFKVQDDMINEVVKEAANHVVGSTIEEVVAGHMTLSRTSDWLEDFMLEIILPVLPGVANEAMHEYEYNSAVNEIIDEVIRLQLREVIVVAWSDVLEIDSNKQLQNLRSYAVDHVLDALCLQHLMSQFTGENLPLYFRDYMDQVLDGVTCGLLTQQYLTVATEQEATQSNVGLKELHENVFCDVALDVLVEELTGHLDEDIQDLTECEKEQSVFEL